MIPIVKKDEVGEQIRRMKMIGKDRKKWNEEEGERSGRISDVRKKSSLA